MFRPTVAGMGPDNEPRARDSGGVPELSIILATLNEAESLPKLLDKIRSLPLPPHEILVVDDGSTDGTVEVARSRAARDPRVRLIQANQKRTLLPAQLQGVDAARADWILVMDADLQHPPELIPRLLEAQRTGGESLIVATRYREGGSPGDRTLTRALFSRGAEYLARLLVAKARKSSDPMSGFFLFHRSLLPRSVRVLGRYKLLLFVLSGSDGEPVGEVGYRFGARLHGESKIVSDFRFLPLFLSEIVEARRYLRVVDAKTAHALHPEGHAGGNDRSADSGSLSSFDLR